MVCLRATEGSGGAEVAQVVGTVNDGLFAALQGEEGPHGWWVVVVMVEMLLLKTLGIFQCPSDRLQQPGELAVASFTVGAAVTRLASVAGFTRRCGDLRAG